MDELKSSVSAKQETNVFHQISLKNRAIYADDIDKAWDKVVEYAIWKDPIINPETDGIYDESIMSPGETLSIIVRIDEAGFAKIREEFGYH